MESVERYLVCKVDYKSGRLQKSILKKTVQTLKPKERFEHNIWIVDWPVRREEEI